MAQSLIATRCKFPATGYDILQPSTTTFVSKHDVPQEATGIQFVFTVNSKTAAYNDGPWANALTISASIEVNGVLTPYKFGGLFSKSFAPGSTPTTDVLAITIPAGSIVTSRVCVTGDSIPTGLFLSAENGNGEGIIAGDQTQAATLGTLRSGWGYTPALILGQTATSQVSVLGFGDSILFGVDDNTRHSYLEQALERLRIPFVNLGIPGDRASQVVQGANSRARTALATLANCTHCISTYLTNDIQDNLTSAQLQDIATALWAFERPFVSQKLIQARLLPKTNSANGFTTAAGQTPFRDELRNPLNDFFDTLPTGIDGVLDVPRAVEVNSAGVLTRNGGRWIPGGTSDGVHPITFGHKTIADDVVGALPALLSIASDVADTEIRLGWRIVDFAAARQVGVLPVDTLDLTSTQAPPAPLWSDLYTRQPGTEPQIFYGVFYNPASWIQDFPEGMDAIIQGFELGPHFGDQTGREFKIFGINKDDSEVLLLTDFRTENERGLTITTPITATRYNRLRYQITNGGLPQTLRVLAEYTPITRPTPPPFAKTPLGYHTGSNAHPYDVMPAFPTYEGEFSVYGPSLEKAKALGSIRMYVDNINIMPVEGVIGWESERQGRNMDALVKTFFDNDIYLVWCCQASTPWLNAGYPNPDANNERAPVPFGADRLDPASWMRGAQIPKQVAYRYGRNKNVDPALVISKEGPIFNSAQEPYIYHKLIGMGWLKEIEPYNEWDKNWKFPKDTEGVYSRVTPQESAVGMEVYYSQIKEADPSMIVTHPGLAFFSPDYFQEMCYWSIKWYGRLPFDKVAGHYYPNTGGTQYSGESNTMGMSAETSLLPEVLRNFRRASYYRIGNVPFDVGEIGYDSSTNSPLRVVVPAGSSYTQRQWAGVLYLRVAQTNAKNGVNRTFHYQWNDLNSDQFNQFAAMGLLYKSGSVWAGYPNFNLLAQLRKNFGAFVHDTELSASPLVDRWVVGQSALFSLYMPTENNSTGSYTLNLPNGGKLYRFDLDTDITPPPTMLPAGNNTIALNEMPVFILAN